MRVEEDEVSDPLKKHEELLKQVLPQNIQNELGAQKIKEMAKPITSSQEMQQKDFAKMLPINGLPSKGLFYEEQIYGRTLTVPELKKLCDINVQNASVVMDDLIKSMVKGVSWQDLLVGDKLYILLWARAHTYPDSKYCVPFECQECGKNSLFHFTIDDIKVNEIREDISIEGPITLSNDDVVTFKYVTMGDESRIQKFKLGQRQSQTKWDDDILSMAISITSVNGEKQSLMSLHSYLQKSPLIYSEIESYLSEFSYGISPIVTVKCLECGGVGHEPLPFRPDFFIPRYRHEKIARNAIPDSETSED